MAGVFCAKETIFGAFVQELLSMPISLLLALLSLPEVPV